ncbi:disease resistance protein Aig2, putative [Talaromyces stipitatus ATCC 10500]|uniref:Putative gamma-glutamylcyclotransferase n=1 Tax=Talaromyces stipitatus (strain ATCC 10500 / CBS 375.48 / QM 6759 / NRRL 1006) TaxID=441959 RepID=B8MDF3_TALSN|nr:disease resistance protein Aig2, putative [Talaromyces stipitatus ATCC 10500]EED17916.1 disease resistance protein Aig2, putative [Talaromyces stipitatus ATCC 10500]
MGDHTFFFYGTLMAPSILHRIIHGSPTPELWQKALLTTRPALLPGYRRYRVHNADYPAILPSSEADSAVLGVVVTGLTEGDVLRLDTFEGSQYEKRTVKVRVLKSTAASTENKQAQDGDDKALQKGLDQTAHLAEGGNETEMDEVEATTYVWTDLESDLDMHAEWDFESFKRDKLQWWITAPEDDL